MQYQTLIASSFILFHAHSLYNRYQPDSTFIKWKQLPRFEFSLKQYSYFFDNYSHPCLNQCQCLNKNILFDLIVYLQQCGILIGFIFLCLWIESYIRSLPHEVQLAKECQDTSWGETVVEDAAIPQCRSLCWHFPLRKAARQSPKRPCRWQYSKEGCQCLQPRKLHC